MSKIEELWYGNIDPHNDIISNTEEMRKLIELMVRHRKTLEEMISDEQKKVFEKYIDCRNEYESLYQAAIFTYAFKLGAKMAAEVFEK